MFKDCMKSTWNEAKIIHLQVCKYTENRQVWNKHNECCSFVAANYYPHPKVQIKCKLQVCLRSMKLLNQVKETGGFSIFVHTLVYINVINANRLIKGKYDYAWKHALINYVSSTEGKSVM